MKSDDYDYDEQVEDVYEEEEPAEEYQEPARHSHARAQETNSNKVVNIHDTISNSSGSI